MKTWAVLFALAGCSFPTPSEELACEVTLDCEGGRVCDRGFCVLPGGDVDGGVDPADGDNFDCTVFDGRHFDGCDLERPGAALELTLAGTYTYDTNSGQLAPPMGAASVPPSSELGGNRVLSVDAFSIASGAQLRVIGNQPLVIASWSTITIASGATIDASSTANERGAGANPAGCTGHAATAGTADAGGAGGGGGGGFNGTGGTGGAGDGGDNDGGPGGGAIAAPLLLGGCAGATGGAGNQPGGTGGHGGGAIQLTAKDSITIGGTLHAGGAGGAGGNGAQSAGGGGGSGGMIGLEATTITIQSGAILAANGGGGGGGSENQIGGPGQNGQPLATRALGGTEVNAGVGGLGSGGAVLTGQVGEESNNNGGGGGGGGAGFIVFATPNAMAPSVAGAILSPTSSTVAK